MVGVCKSVSGSPRARALLAWLIGSGALALAGCSSDNSTSPSADAGADGTTAADGAADGAAACPLDASLLPQEGGPALDPATAACQACLANPSSRVRSGAGGGTCLQAFVSCNADCACKTGVLGIAACVQDGGTAGACAVRAAVNPSLAGDVPFLKLFDCEGNACAEACNPSADGGRSDAGSDGGAGDGSAGDGSADGGAHDGSTDAASADGSATDAGPTDAGATDGSAEDGSAADGSADAGTGDAGDASTADAGATAADSAADGAATDAATDAP